MYYTNFYFLGTLNKVNGIYIFINDKIHIADIILNLIPGCNSLELTFNYNLQVHKIIGLYGSPSLTVDSFLVSLDHYLSNISGN